MSANIDWTLASHRLSIKCPVCGGHPARIYRCGHCGEVRCGLDTCGGSFGQHQAWAGQGAKCRNCGIGFYRAMDTQGEEMAEFIQSYRRRPPPSDLEALLKTATGNPWGTSGGKEQTGRSQNSSGFRRYQGPKG